MPPIPGEGRFQAVTGVDRDTLYVFGGLRHEFNGAGKRVLQYLTDAYCYSPVQGWRRLPDMPFAAASAASPAPASNGDIFLIGGVDGSGAGKSPLDFHQASQRIQKFRTDSKKWNVAGNAPVGRVCISAAQWLDCWVLPSGERSAGIRSPEVWALNIITTPPDRSQ